MFVGVYAGFGTLADAQRFSWVGLTVLNIEALTGDDERAKGTSPPQSTRHRISRSGRRLCLLDDMAFMG